MAIGNFSVKLNINMISNKTLLLIQLLITSSVFSQIISEKDLVGTYGDTTCFRASECCVSKLKIKEDKTYILVMIGINHGRKNKTTYKGTWKMENELITLIPDKNKKNLKEELEAEIYQFYQKTLLYENQGKYDPGNIAFKKNP